MPKITLEELGEGVATGADAYSAAWDAYTGQGGGGGKSTAVATTGETFGPWGEPAEWTGANYAVVGGGALLLFLLMRK